MANTSGQSIHLSPLDSEQYFASPLATILESINDPQSEVVTLHDLTEAYATLSRRIRHQATLIQSGDRMYPAFTPFYSHSSSLSLCLIRDIGRCLINPLFVLSQGDSASDDSSIIEEGTERAQAYATLSHHALVFLSDVFSFVPLMNTLPATQQSDLLREVLLILTITHLPTPNVRKTMSLATWVVVSQRLHPDVILSQKEVIRKVLARLVSRSYDGHSFKAEGLKLSVHLRRQPTEFLDTLLQLYPHILTVSEGDPFEVQLQILDTLRCIVSLKLDSPDSKWSQKIAKQTHAFIKSQSAKHIASQQGSLPAILLSAMAGTDNHGDYRGPLWAILFIACLICICDSGTFTHGHSLKLFLSVLAQATNHRRSYARALHPFIWNCLVWCYSRLPTTENDPQTGQDFVEIRKRAFLVLRQELKGGIATTLAASWLSSSPETNDFSPIWDLLKDLFSSSKESQIREGVRLLCRLLSVILQPSTPDPRNSVRDLSGIVIRDLFVGSFLNLPENQMRTLLNRLPGPDDRFVRPLTEKQIRDNWKMLVELWALAVKSTFVPSVRFQQYEDQLLSAWKSLLLVQSQTKLDSISPSSVDIVISVVVGFLTDVTSNHLCQLRLVYRLWSVIKQSFVATSLNSIAEAVLSKVLSRRYTLEDETKTAWSILCGDLIAIGVPNLLPSLITRSELPGGLQVQRQLWVVMAESEVFKGKGNEWEEIISFLVIPIRSWSIDLQEVDIWNRLFLKAVKLERVPSCTPHNSLDAVFERLGGDLHRLRDSPGLIPLLLPHLCFSTENALHLDFLGLVNKLMVESYPPDPEDHIVALPILEGIARLILACENGRIIRLLSVLNDGLCLWIRDEHKALLEQEHSTLIHDIYCASLSVLSKLPPSLNTVQTLSAFLASSFERMGHPPIGPLAFEQFWRATYHEMPESFKGLLPDNLKTCLKAWSDHCGDSLAEGVSSFHDSPTTTRSYVPDSQSPDKAFYHSEDHIFSGPMDSDDIYDLVAPGSEPEFPFFTQCTPTPRTPRATTPKATHSQTCQNTKANGDILSVKSDGEPAIGKKRSYRESECSTPRGKRRRIGDEKSDSRSTSQTGSIQKASPTADIVQPSSPFPEIELPLTRSPRRNQPHRRLIVPPSSSGERFVPESSSPAAFIVPFAKKLGCDHDDTVNVETEELPTLNFRKLTTTPIVPSDKTRKPGRLKSSPYERLQSEPVIESSPLRRPTRLRRNHTTSERLGALERAYTLVADSQGSSQVPIEELAHAAHLAHKIGAKIAERMSKKFPEGPL